MEAAALVMAGGAASRMGGAPKPLLEACGRRIIEHSLSAVEAVARVTVLALSPRAPPGLRAYCGERLCIETPGAGYPEDLRLAASAVTLRPLIVVAADLVGLKPQHLETLLQATTEADVVTLTCRGEPLGISLLRGRGWSWASVEGGCDVVNVNTWSDLARAEGACG